MENVFEWERDILGDYCSTLRDGGLCHSDKNRHKEKLKDSKYIWGVELRGLVNKMNVRNEEK